jgi:outer membrane protein assembly factor BamB
MRSRGGAGLAVLALLTAGVLLAGCSGPAPPSPVPTRTAPAAPAHPAPALSPADWPEFGHDAARTGAAGGVPPPGTLSVAWHRPLDGAVYAQPLVVGGRVVAATENGTVYALNAATGSPIWHRHIANPVTSSDLPCGNISPLGITGTPAYDPATGRVFAVAETSGGEHVLAGISLATGQIEVQREIEPPRGDKLATQQRTALTLYGGRVYVGFGGLFGDCGNYVGSVVSVATTGQGPVTSWSVPTSRRGGIWATGGVVVAGNRLLVSAGNGAAVSPSSRYDGSDTVTALSPGLRRLDFFAPASWADDNANDLDLGSMTPAVADGYVFIAGKRGTGYVLRTAHLGGIGGQAAQLNVCVGWGTAAVSGNTVYVPCRDGPMRQVTVGANGTPHPGWTAGAPGSQGSPATGGGAIWTVNYTAGMLYALNPATGAVRASIRIGPAPHFAAPSLSGSRAYTGTLTGVTAISGA